MNQNLQGIVWKIVNLMFFSIITIMGKKLSSNTHVFTAFGLSMVFASICLIIIKFIIKKQITLRNLKTYFLRAILNIIGLTTWFYALTLTNTIEAAAISFTTPLMAMLIAKIYLKEQLDPLSLTAVIIGMFGSIYLIKPSYVTINIGNLLAFFSAIAWALHDVICKIQATKEPIFDQTLIVFSLVALLCIPLNIYEHSIPSFIDVSWIALMGLLFVFNVFALVKSYSLTNLVVVMPLSFMRLIFTSILAFIFFGETISDHAIIGSAIILSAALIMIFPNVRDSKSHEN